MWRDKLYGTEEQALEELINCEKKMVILLVGLDMTDLAAIGTLARGATEILLHPTRRGSR